jgi:hypothetical protein
MNWPEAFVAATAIVSVVFLLLGLVFLASGPEIKWSRRTERPIRPAKHEEALRDPGK